MSVDALAHRPDGAGQLSADGVDLCVEAIRFLIESVDSLVWPVKSLVDSVESGTDRIYLLIVRVDFLTELIELRADRADSVAQRVDAVFHVGVSGRALTRARDRSIRSRDSLLGNLNGFVSVAIRYHGCQIFCSR